MTTLAEKHFQLAGRLGAEKVIQRSEGVRSNRLPVLGKRLSCGIGEDGRM